MLFNFICIVTLLAALLCPVGAQSRLEPKDIFEKGLSVVEGTTTVAPALKYEVLLKNDGGESLVHASRRFVDGEQFRLRFTISKDSHVYVLHRTLEGNPDDMNRYLGEAGIRTLRKEDSLNGAPGKYQLLYPASNTGTQNRAIAGKQSLVPEGGRFFRMDRNIGVEKLVIIVSPNAMNVASLFGMVSGGTALNAEKQFQSMEENTVQSKQLIPESYAAAKASAKPIMVNVDLRHYRRE